MNKKKNFISISASGYENQEKYSIFVSNLSNELLKGGSLLNF